MRIVNLTPHPIVIKGEEDIVVEPSGFIARLNETVVPAGQIQIGGHVVNLFRRELGEVTGLPEGLEAGDAVIVSSLTAEPLKRARPELVILVPGEAVRDNEGRIIGVKNLFKVE